MCYAFAVYFTFYVCLFGFFFSPARCVCTWTVLDGPFDSVSVFYYYYCCCYYFYVNTKTSRHFSGAPVYISFRFLFCFLFLSRSKNFYCCIFSFCFFHCGLTKKKKTSFPKEAWRLEFRLRTKLICKPNSTWLCRTFSFLLIEGLVASHDASLTWRVTRRHGGTKEEDGEPRWRHRAWLSLLSHPLLKNEDTHTYGSCLFQTDQCTKFVFRSTSLWGFIWIRTQASSVFSEVSAAPNRTMRKCPAESGFGEYANK